MELNHFEKKQLPLIISLITYTYRKKNTNVTQQHLQNGTGLLNIIIKTVSLPQPKVISIPFFYAVSLMVLWIRQFEHVCQDVLVYVLFNHVFSKRIIVLLITCSYSTDFRDRKLFEIITCIIKSTTDCGTNQILTSSWWIGINFKIYSVHSGIAI